MREQKLLGLLLAIGLCVVAGIFWYLDDEKDASKDSEASTVAVEAPDEATTGAVSEEQVPEIMGEPVGEEMAGKVLLSTRPVQVLSAPSESASAMFGFPAGRPFRAISKKDGFVRIQDVKSGASGWIEEAALKPAPPPKPVVAAPAPSTPRSTSSGGAKPRPTFDTTTAAAEPEPAPQRKRRGLFGGDGFLGGLFGGN